MGVKAAPVEAVHNGASLTGIDAIVELALKALVPPPLPMLNNWPAEPCARSPASEAQRVAAADSKRRRSAARTHHSNSKRDEIRHARQRACRSPPGSRYCSVPPAAKAPTRAMPRGNLPPSGRRSPGHNSADRDGRTGSATATADSDTVGTLRTGAWFGPLCDRIGVPLFERLLNATGRLLRSQECSVSLPGDALGFIPACERQGGRAGLAARHEPERRIALAARAPTMARRSARAASRCRKACTAPSPHPAASSIDCQEVMLCGKRFAVRPVEPGLAAGCRCWLRRRLRAGT